MIIDVFIATLIGIIIFIIGLISIVLIIEQFKPSYGLTKNRNGMTFRFRLGIHIGEVNLIRRDDSGYPTAKRTRDGWDCYFPKHWTDARMLEELPYLNQAFVKDTPTHTKDLMIMDQIVNKKNNLKSILGKIVIPI